MASTATIMKELFQEFSSNLDAKLDLIRNLNDDATVNPVDEPAILKARRLQRRRHHQRQQQPAVTRGGSHHQPRRRQRQPCYGDTAG
jgi:hypothetical protein